MLAVPSSAAALAAGQADAQSPLQIGVSPKQVGYGDLVRVAGTAPASAAGETVLLRFEPPAGTAWQTLARTRIGSSGRFRFAVPLRRSGRIEAITASGATPAAAGPRVPAAGDGGALVSDAATIAVAPKLRVARHAYDVLGGQRINVRGKLLPGLPGRRVRLEDHAHGAWQVIGSSRTGARGGFDIRYRPGGPWGNAHGHTLRVVFGGDGQNAAATRRAGRVIVFRQSVASWYNDAGTTACGFHAGLGVANKSLPCGTKVTFRYGGNTVVATVDDRGPYVGGREWDLNQNLAAALGFSGVGTVWTTAP